MREKEIDIDINGYLGPKDFPDDKLRWIYKDEAWKHYKKAMFIGKKLADKIALSEMKD